MSRKKIKQDDLLKYKYSFQKMLIHSPKIRNKNVGTIRVYLSFKQKKNNQHVMSLFVRSIKYFRPCFDLILQRFYYKIS